MAISVPRYPAVNWLTAAWRESRQPSCLLNMFVLHGTWFFCAGVAFSWVQSCFRRGLYQGFRAEEGTHLLQGEACGDMGVDGMVRNLWLWRSKLKGAFKPDTAGSLWEPPVELSPDNLSGEPWALRRAAVPVCLRSPPASGSEVRRVCDSVTAAWAEGRWLLRRYEICWRCCLQP